MRESQKVDALRMDSFKNLEAFKRPCVPNMDCRHGTEFTGCNQASIAIADST